MRYRLTFSKTTAMRFTGNLDLHRSLDRTVRRARLPLSHTQGYTSRTRLAIASPLPLGVTGEAELADLWLDEALPSEEICQRINAAAPPGIIIHAVEAIEETAPKLQSGVRASDFRVTLLEPIPDLDAQLARVHGADALPRVRRGKEYDLRPLILALALATPDDAGNPQLAMTLLARDSATGRPDEVVAELGGDPFAARYHRTKIHLE